jgi:hypothetical protein
VSFVFVDAVQAYDNESLTAAPPSKFEIERLIDGSGQSRLLAPRRHRRRGESSAKPLGTSATARSPASILAQFAVL